MSEPLYHLGKDKALRTWKVWTEGAKVFTEYGLVTGQKLTSQKTVTQKNVGKANETSLVDQANAEAAAMYKFKLDRKYSTTPEEACELVRLPMLAKDFDKVKGPIPWPVDVQPKLDGVRCFAYWDQDEVILLSRGGKTYNVPHIKKAFERFLPKNITFDGELYAHGRSCQQINALVKKNRPESLEIQFRVYDCIIDEDPGDTWEKRNERLQSILEEFKDSIDSCIRCVPTLEAANQDDLERFYLAWVNLGYEGAIVRIKTGKYLYGFRSGDLLKVKSFMDKEFPVVNAYQGVGRFEGCITWVCVTEEGKEFSVCPKGTLEEKQQAWEDWVENPEAFKGQFQKVKFFGYTDEGIPRFPVGLGFRLPEDM